MSSSDTTPTLPMRETARWSIAGRITIWYVASALLLIAVATGMLYWVLVTDIQRENDQYLADEVQILRSVIRDRPDDLSVLRQEAEWEHAARRYARVYIRVLDEQHHVVVETPGASSIFDRQSPPAAESDAPPGPGVDGALPDGTPLRMLAAWALRGPAGADRRLIETAIDDTAHRALLARFRAQLWGVLGASLLAAGVLGYAMARRSMRPIEAITTTARDVRSSTLDRRIPTGGLPTELSCLAETFNQMIARLEDAFARLSNLAVYLAHELRTPVNSLRGEMEVALGKPRSDVEYRAVLESALEECVRLSGMIDALLFLARADLPETQVERTAIDVDGEVARVCEFYEPAATEGGVAITVQPRERPIVAMLDRTLFQRAVSNLLANAIAHTPAGGQVTVALSSYSGTLRVEVADTGEGIAQEHLTRVSDQFYRVEPSRQPASGGLGLGLAIVQSIMTVHGGRLDLASERGRGTTATLTFPRAVLERPPGAARNAT